MQRAVHKLELIGEMGEPGIGSTRWGFRWRVPGTPV